MTALNGHILRAKMATGDQPGDIVSALLKAAQRLRTQIGEFLERYEMTEGRFAILTALEHAGSAGLSQAAVAEELMQSESNVSTLIERLHHDGLVDRRWSNKDRRKRVLLLTPAGQVLFDQIEAARREWAGELLSGVGDDDRRVLAATLRDLSSTTGVKSVRRTDRRNAVTAHKSHDKAQWQDGESVESSEPASPQFALERMLSTLGLAGRFAEAEQ